VNLCNLIALVVTNKEA